MPKKTQKPRPWLLQYRWKSERDYELYCYKSRSTAYASVWRNGASTYVDKEGAEKGLKKQFLDPFFDSMVGGREWRLINKETQETLTVVIEEKQIILI